MDKKIRKMVYCKSTESCPHKKHGQQGGTVGEQCSQGCHCMYQSLNKYQGDGKKMITRSVGLPVTGTPYHVGSGYQGRTEELDNTVKREAELLAKTFNRDIEVRFNSDRESGGAWLVNSRKGFNGNCQVGFNAGLRAVRPEGMNDETYFNTFETLPTRICIDTNVKESALKDPTLANSGNPNYRYCWLEHKSVEDGLAWLVANVDTDKLYR